MAKMYEPKWTGKSVMSLKLYRKRPFFMRLDLALLVIMFAIVLHSCYETAGVPYQAYLQKKLDDESAEFGGEIGSVVLNATEKPAKAIDIGENDEKIFDNLGVEEEDLKDDDPFKDMPSFSLWGSGQKESGSSWFDDVENLYSEEEEEIPYELQPDFWPLFSLSVALWVACLWALGQHWSVHFKTYLQCVPAESLKTAAFVKAIPRPHRGKAALVPLEDHKSPYPKFIFQKIRFEYNPTNMHFEKVKCPTNKAISFYSSSNGVADDDLIDDLRRKYGMNRFEIPMPLFSDMYLGQITQPFFVFQIFCVLLWCLEEYWQYSLFSLVMLLGFEATTVQTRRVNIKRLRGMGNKALDCIVLRRKRWKIVSTEELVPGDIVKLKAGTNDEGIIPCDCLLLDGSAVVNEATLTGESVPLMKDSLNVGIEENKLENDTAAVVDVDRKLDIKGNDRIHTLFGGTKLMEATSYDVDGTEQAYVKCFVLRTGFSSSQGKLVRRIEFSTEKVNGNVWEAGLLLGFLLCFAIASSSYVLYRGLNEGKRTRFDILLHCILIITSVVPPDLPMQMALTVNTSLTALMGVNVFCTEPHRIPLAGNIDVCCFDKTGTLTTDKLNAAGVVVTSDRKMDDGLLGMPNASDMMKVVIGGCNSLIFSRKQVMGDPLEMAALQSIGWSIKNGLAMSKASANEQQNNSKKMAVKIVQRHHFLSALQRMSVICNVINPSPELKSISNKSNKSNQGSGHQLTCSLVKGSPEMIYTLLKNTSQAKPEWYDSCHKRLAKEGYRVIALAYKELVDKEDVLKSVQDRDNAESDLFFAGFMAFNCKNRADTKYVLMELANSSHKCIMITGDSLLTAAHVAGEVSLVSSDKNNVLLLQDNKQLDGLGWVSFETEQPVASFSPSTIVDLSTKYGLCISGNILKKAIGLDCEIEKYFHCISVFARMKPDQKEHVITCMKKCNYITLMCGDGTNDVGALKASDVGLALLSGFGDSNAETSKNNEMFVQKLKVGDRTLTPQEEAYINDPMVTQVIRDKRLKLLKDNEKIKKLSEKFKKEGAYFPVFKARMEIVMKQQKEMLEEKKQEQLEKQNPRLKIKTEKDEGKKESDQPQNPWDILKNMEEEAPQEQEMVKLGDASIAAPFTSKMPSIKSVLDIIRQGRCTLLTTIQMYQILALNCLISSYSLSVLYLDGVKYGQAQMTAMGTLGTVCFLCISRAKPLPNLSPIKPPGSIFHPSLFLSLLGQFAVHLATLVYTSGLARENLPEDYEPDLNGKFKANIINSVIFLVTCVQQVCVFGINYKGRPFMQNITENSAFMIALLICVVGTFLIATESIPLLNKYLEIVPMIDETFKFNVLSALALDAILSLVWDRLMMVVFYPKIIPYMKFTADDLRRTLKMLAWASLIIYILMPTEEDILDMEEMIQN